jgi:hypothetical protein
VQRVLLGQYAFTLGPLTVPVIGGAEVAMAAQAATQGLAVQVPSSGIERAGRGEDPAASTDLAWENANDPNLALAGWRLDLEQRLRRLVRTDGIDDQGDAEELLRRLLNQGVIEPSAAGGLQELLDIATRAMLVDSPDKALSLQSPSSGSSRNAVVVSFARRTTSMGARSGSSSSMAVPSL